MTFTRVDKDGEALLKIEGSMSVYEAAALRDEMISCFDTFDSLILDLKGVNDCDTAGIQLLCAARKTAANADKILSVVEASLALMDVISGAGLNPEDIFELKKQPLTNKNEKSGDPKSKEGVQDA